LTTDYTDDTDAGRIIVPRINPLPIMRSAGSLLFAVFLLSVSTLQAQREKLPPDDLIFVEKTWPDAKKTNSGIRYVILREGTGPSPKAGNHVSVHYVGKLLDGKIFDQNHDPANPFTFRIGRDQVIQGWDQLLPLMKVGEKRLAIIPPELAYGSRGQAPRIPRNATLIFEMELLEIKKE
jgi:FKBP-type peptidyl-prolyl cis-trans isomerase